MNYKELGFKAGLEIHQQLDTNKLFCSCPSLLRDDPHDIVIKRRLRSVVGESGKFDIAAQHESLKNREFIYEAYSNTNCLVEFDEEPPHELNKKALNICLQICKLLKCKIVDEIQIMRKIVVDGSNTSGFQRTALVGYGGIIETTKGPVKIETVCLEEDSARKISETKNTTTYRLDRLGIPLIEIATAPDIKDPEHCKETAEKLGMFLRSINGIKRGIGTIRQDVNVSIKKGARVEIKGFQDVRTMPKVINHEVERQKKSKKIKEEVRRANSDGTTDFLRPMPTSSRMYPETDVPTILITKEMLNKIEIPELIDEKVIRYEKEGLSSELARSLIKSGINLEEYNYNLDKKLIANVLVEIPKDMKSRLNIDYKFKEEQFRFILDALEKNKITKESIQNILIEFSKGKKPNLKLYAPISNDNLEKEIKKIVNENKDLTIGAIMGIVMKKMGGKIDGKLAAALVAKYKN